MAAIFFQTLNMSMTGSVVILLVMLARLILKRSPKIFSYALWFAILFRLLCPVAFTAPISVLDVVESEQKETLINTSIPVTPVPKPVKPLKKPNNTVKILYYFLIERQILF